MDHVAHHSVWETKEISGFFWFRSELADALPEEELAQLLSYFSVVHDAWMKCFNCKVARSPIFRFKRSSEDPTHLKIQMLRLNDETKDDAVLAEKAVCVTGQGVTLSLLH